MEVIKEVSQHRSAGGKRNLNSHSKCSTTKHKKSVPLRRSNSDPSLAQDGGDELFGERLTSSNLNESVNLDITLNTSIIKQPYEESDSSMIHHYENQISPSESVSNSLEKT